MKKCLQIKPLRYVSRPLPLFVVALAALLGLPVDGGARDIGPAGGGGGGPFRTSCDGGQLVGFDVVATHVLIKLAPVCGDRKASPTDTYGRSWVGGNAAGTLRKVRCEPDSVLTILHVFWDKTPLVNRLGFTCWNTRNNKMTNSLPNYGGQAVADKRLVCPKGEVATGIFGRAGGAIDQLGLICEPWQVAAAPTPDVGEAPTPPPAENVIDVVLDTDVFDAPDGNGNKIGELDDETDTVVLLAPCRDGWCNVKWRGGLGWVFSGQGHESLALK